MYKIPDYQLQGTRAAFNIIKKDIEAYLDFLDLAQKHTGIADESFNGSRIRIRFFMLLNEGLNGKQAIRCLAEEFYCSVKTIERHLYRYVFKKKRPRTILRYGDDCR